MAKKLKTNQKKSKNLIFLQPKDLLQKFKLINFKTKRFKPIKNCLLPDKFKNKTKIIMARDQIIKKILLVHLRSAVIKTVSLNQIFNKVIHPFKRLKEKRKCKKAKIFSINQDSKGNKKYKYRFRKRIQVYSNPATFLDSLGTKNL